MDPVFGKLTLNRLKGHWFGQVMFPPTGREVELWVTSDGLEPTEEHRTCFLALADRYEALRPTIAAALFHEWSENEYESIYPAISVIEQMQRHMLLNWIAFEDTTRMRVGYEFATEVEWDKGNTLSVLIDNWHVTDARVDP